jgi:DNA-binding transcriptional regulator GbsR (MarR family)
MSSGHAVNIYTVVRKHATKHKPLTTAELAVLGGTSAGNVSSYLTYLHRAGVIECQRYPHPRRYWVSQVLAISEGELERRVSAEREKARNRQASRQITDLLDLIVELESRVNRLEMLAKTGLEEARTDKTIPREVSYLRRVEDLKLPEPTFVECIDYMLER